MSLDVGIISFNLKRQKSINQGQMYIFYVKLETLEFLVGNYNRAAIKVTFISEKKYAWLRKESQLQTMPVTKIKENTLTVTLLNTRSLRQHLDYILSDKHLLCSDIIDLTEEARS